MRLLFDMEANGLRPDKIWCLVAKDLDTGQVYEFHNGQEGLNNSDYHALLELFSDVADEIIGHNIIGYDLFWLNRLGVVTDEDICEAKITDTLVLSRLLYPDREGGHSVEAWAKREGWPVQKQAHEDWSRFSPEMLERCRSDVEIQERIYYALEKEIEGWDWSLSSRISHAMEEELTACSENGWKFDKRRAERYTKYLDHKMQVYYAELKPLLGRYPDNKGEVKRPFKKDGSYSKMVEDWRESEDIGGPFTRIEWTPYELTQHEKVAKRLVTLGWQPTEYTSTGVPKLKPNGEPCPNLEKVGDVGPTLAAYSKCSHRRNQIAGWLEACREDGRVPAGFAGITNTGRRRHKVIANIPKAEDSVFFGRQMRRLFTCDKGRVLVGCDASGLEMRKLAHYMDDDEFTKELLTGDIHTVMWEATNGIIDSRSVTKNCEYAMIYGASDYKIGLTAGYSQSEAKKVGEEIRNCWGRRFPKLEKLIEGVSKASKRGWLKGLDGRKIWMRRGESGQVLTHKALNTLLQGGGAVIMDVATLYQRSWIRARQLDSYVVSYYHDEDTRDTHPDHAEEVGRLMEKAITQSGKYFNIRCPLEGEHKIGKTWEDIH